MTPGYEACAPPRLLAPLAPLLRSRGARMQISASSSRSILESVATRIDEARDITRYLTNLLIFLGLLGTFYGLATTVPAVVETIRSLAPQEGETGLDVFGKLMKGLESQLGGMGTAFSSSLLGLAGSLVVGLAGAVRQPRPEPVLPRAGGMAVLDHPAGLFLGRGGGRRGGAGFGGAGPSDGADRGAADPVRAGRGQQGRAWTTGLERLTGAVAALAAQLDGRGGADRRRCTGSPKGRSG